MALPDATWATGDLIPEDWPIEIARGVASLAAINLAGTGTYTLSATEYQQRVHVLSGLLTGNRNVVTPGDGGRWWIVRNDTTGAFTVTYKTSGGTGIVIPQGNTAVVYDDGTNVVAALVEGSALTDITQAGATPRWFKVTKGFADFSTAGTALDIEAWALPAGGIIHATKIKHSAAFTGGAISAYTVSLGIVGTLAKYGAAFSVFGAPSNTSFQVTGTIGSESHGAAVSIRAAAVSTGANLNAATAGSVELWALVSKAL